MNDVPANRVPALRDALIAAAARRRAASDATAPVGVTASAPTRLALTRARRTIQHARRVPLLVAALATVLLSTAVALAASGLIQTGAPVKPLFHFTPTSGFGVPLPATVRLLSNSVADPAGGPRWGLRYLETTRGLGCVQVGRVVNGRLGVLGRDGTFANDGRFHELPADVFEPLGCAPLDRHRHAFVGLTFHGLPASATSRVGCLPVARIAEREHDPTCSLADERLVSYGLLGPDARTLSYRVGSATHTLPITGPLGAYLIVQPISARRGQQLGLLTPMTSPAASPFTKVTYASGAICRIPPANRPGGARACPLVGWVAPRVKPPTAAAVAARVTARVGPVAHIANPAFAHRTLLVRRLHLTFTARVGVSSANSRYLVQLSPPRRGACVRNDHAVRLSPIERDVAAGEVVHVGLSLEPACPGRWHGRVLYFASLGRGGSEPLAAMKAILNLDARTHAKGAGTPPLVVGRFAVTIH